MSAQAAEPLGAICAYLSATTVAAVVTDDPSMTGGQAIYRPRLPDESDLPVAMPFACIVLRRAGGYALLGGGRVPEGDPRVQFTCYGSEQLEADRVAAELVLALRGLAISPQHVFEGVRLLWARIEGGPLPMVDPEDWPSSVVSAQIAHTEVALA